MGNTNKYKPYNKGATKTYVNHFFKTIPGRRSQTDHQRTAKVVVDPIETRNQKSLLQLPLLPEILMSLLSRSREKKITRIMTKLMMRPSVLKKKSQTNWGTPSNRPRIEKAINDYLNKEENEIDSNGVFIEDRNNYAGLLVSPTTL